MSDVDDHPFWIAIVSFGGFAFQFGLLIAICGAGIFFYQGVLWFWEGHWTPMPIGVHIPHNPDSDWSQALVNEIADWLFDLPFGLVVITLGVAVLVGAVWLDSLAWDQIGPHRRRQNEKR